MPTYDYICTSCNDKFELFQSIKEEPAKTCGKCGGAVRRLIGLGAGVIYKGTGFYATDYKNSGNANTSQSVVPPSPCSTCESSVCKANQE